MVRPSVIPVHSRNALFPMVLRLSLSVTPVRFLQLENADSSIVAMFDGMVRVPVMPLKANVAFLIESIPEGRVMFARVSFLHSKNACFPRLSSVSGSEMLPIPVHP